MADPAPLALPFRGERFAGSGTLTNLVCPPYDVLGPEARAAYAERHPDNFVHLILPDGSPKTRYGHAVKVLADWRKREAVAIDPAPAVYVVQQEFTTPDERTFTRTGVIAAIAAEPYETGRVRPHERTHRGPKEDRLALLEATHAQTEAIFLVSPDERGHLRRRLEGVTRHEPHAVADLDGVKISLWHVHGVQAGEIARAVGDQLYIADGHHRYETAVAASERLDGAARLPALVVPAGDPGLVVLATHRMIRGGTPEPAAVEAALSQQFTVEVRDVDAAGPGLEAELAGEGIRCVVAVGGRTFVCRAESDGRLPLVSIEEHAVEPLRATVDGTIAYSPDPAVILKAVEEGAVGVFVPPTPLAAVLATADAGGVMPPKSTYFVPKVPSGLVWMPLDEQSAS